MADSNSAGFFSKEHDLRNRILFTILILSVYRLGTYVPLPGIDPESLQNIMQSKQKSIRQRTYYRIIAAIMKKV